MAKVEIPFGDGSMLIMERRGDLVEVGVRTTDGQYLPRGAKPLSFSDIRGLAMFLRNMLIVELESGTVAGELSLVRGAVSNTIILDVVGRGTIGQIDREVFAERVALLEQAV